VRKIFILPLIMLAGLASCGSGQSTTNPGAGPGNASGDSQRKIDAGAQNLSRDQELFSKGIDFAASGNNPSWTLEIDFDKSISFSSQDGLVISTPPVTGTKAMDANVTFYHARTEAYDIRITVSGEKCSDKVTGEELNNLVRIEARYTADADYRSYEGCGRFIYDYRLHDIWLLKEATGVEMNAEKLTKGLPVFEFNPGDGRLTGHAGCNNINAGIELKGDMITFGRIIVTRMACPDMSTEQAVISKIDGKSFRYSISEGTLRLDDGAGNIMTFRKID
jgi:heat shock protein HslJ/uncharacterized membrane protein